MSSIQHLVDAHAITTAQTVAVRGKVHRLPDETAGLTAYVNFVVGGGGTTAKVYIQTSFDDKSTWMDIMSFAFTTSSAKAVLSVREETAITAAVTPVDGALAAGAVSGAIGKYMRAKVVTTGTYTGTTTVDVRVRVEHGTN
jgi:hypothetical protein